MLDNALIHQKDYIISLIDNQEFSEAILLLRFCKELWEVSEYGYKHRELLGRLEQQLKLVIDNGCHWKTRNKIEGFQMACRSLLNG